MLTIKRVNRYCQQSCAQNEKDFKWLHHSLRSIKNIAQFVGKAIFETVKPKESASYWKLNTACQWVMDVLFSISCLYSSSCQLSFSDQVSLSLTM